MADKTIKIGGKDFSPETVQNMLDAGITIGQKNDTVQSNFVQSAHGFSQNFPETGGLWTRPGVEPDVFSVVLGVLGSLLPRLYAGTTDITNPMYDVITGVGAATGSNPTSYAGTAVAPGDVKIGTTMSRFGKVFMSTDKVQLPTAGGKANRADVDRNVINALSQQELLPSLNASNLNTFLGLQFYAMMVHYARVMRRVLFTGNYQLANTSTESGFIREFDGFDKLIKTGYTDLESGAAVAAMDSIVTNFSNVDFTSNAGGASLVDLLENTMFRLMTIAQAAGLDPVNWEIAMRDEVFYALTRVYGYHYHTMLNAGSGSNGERVNVTGESLTRMRDEMYNGKFLWIQGRRIAVNTENGIERSLNGAGYKSTIYIIPMTAAGRRVTYLEAFNQANSEVEEFVRVVGANYRTQSNGLWAMAHNQTNMAFEMLFAQQPRLVMRTPFLAARIENVGYTLSEGYPRDAYVGDAYYVNGGRYVSKPYGEIT